MFPIFSVGDPGELTYEYKIIGNKYRRFKKIFNKEESFIKIISSKKP